MTAHCGDCGKTRSPNSGFSHEDCKDPKQGTPRDGEMTFEQIAEKLGISRQAVESIYHSAIAKMRKALKKDTK